MKKGFTLAEALITVAIIGVLAAVVMPIIDNVRPDKDKVTYKKALYSMQTAISNAMDSSSGSVATNSAAYWGDEKVSASDFCNALSESLNTSGSVNCTSASSYESPNFITTDGIRYWGLEGKAFNLKEERDGGGNVTKAKKYTRDICIDRKLSASEYSKINSKRGRGDDYSADCAGGMKIQVRYDGKIMTPSDSSYAYENELIEQSHKIHVGNDD